MILTLYARAPLLCVDSVCARAAARSPPPSVVRATEVSLAQTEIAFITLYEPPHTTRRHTDWDHHPQPTSGGLAQSAGELWLGVRQRASPPERCSPVSTVIISTTAAAHAD